MDPIASWTWDFGDGVASNIQNPSHTYGSTGNYIVCLTIVTNDGCTSTFCDTISLGNGNCIDTSLIDSTMICPLGLVPVCGCDSVTYDNACYATYYGGVTSWSQGACPWDVCASATNLQNISTTATTANLSWSDQGANMYKVKYKCVSCPSPVQTKTVTGGNYNTTLHNLTPCAIYRWKVIHRCDGVRYASPVSAPFLTAGCRLGEVPGADILDVYPNPASEKLNVTYYAWEDSEAKITVHDLIGRMVFEDAVELAEGNSLVELSLSDFENGIYLLTLSDGVETSIKKFMVSK